MFTSCSEERMNSVLSFQESVIFFSLWCLYPVLQNLWYWDKLVWLCVCQTGSGRTTSAVLLKSRLCHSSHAYHSIHLSLLQRSDFTPAMSILVLEMGSGHKLSNKCSCPTEPFCRVHHTQYQLPHCYQWGSIGSHTHGQGMRSTPNTLKWML